MKFNCFLPPFWSVEQHSQPVIVYVWVSLRTSLVYDYCLPEVSNKKHLYSDSSETRRLRMREICWPNVCAIKTTHARPTYVSQTCVFARILAMFLYPRARSVTGAWDKHTHHEWRQCCARWLNLNHWFCFLFTCHYALLEYGRKLDCLCVIWSAHEKPQSATLVGNRAGCEKWCCGSMGS